MSLMTMLPGILSQQGPTFTPTDIANIGGWYDFSDTTTITHTGGLVDTVTDKSGNGINLVSTGTARPLTNSTSQNGLNTVYFDGVNDYLLGSAFNINLNTIKEVTAFVVYDNDRTGNYEGVLEFKRSGGYGIQCFELWRRIQYSAFTAGDNSTIFGGTHYKEDRALGDASWTGGHRVHRGVISATSNTKTMHINGVAQTLTAESGSMAPSSFMANTADQKICLGANGHGTAQWFQGNIADVIWYNRELTGTECSDVETYLTDKWGL